MKNTLLSGAVLASIALLGLTSSALAQSDSKKSTPPAKHSKPTSKPHKVWTEDDLGSVHPAAVEPENQTAQAGATEQGSAANQTSTSKQPQKGVPPPTLTNPKSVADADKMIAWEGRDIQAQEEFIARLRTQIDEAPADQKERLAKLLQERTQILANTHNELKNLQNKRKELEKPPSGTQTASAEPTSN
jgi:flagellum-specific peptidoglycan hydrolase FlgJ